MSVRKDVISRFPFRPTSLTVVAMVHRTLAWDDRTRPPPVGASTRLIMTSALGAASGPVRRRQFDAGDLQGMTAAKSQKPISPG